MDTGTSIIAIILMAVCVLPFILIRIKNAKKRKRHFAVLQTIAGENNCRIDMVEFWSDSAIAIDTPNKKLLFSTDASNAGAYTVTDLQHVTQCVPVKTEGTAGLLKLELQLTGNGRDEFLEFYSEDRRTTLAHELELANKWCAIIGETLNAYPKAVLAG